ncbi:MAG: hypothetical protein PVS3B3_26000 [Ktedonobacteraceae bacterium]
MLLCKRRMGTACIELLCLGALRSEQQYTLVLSRQRVVELLRERAKAQRKVPSFLKTLPTEEVLSQPSKHPELIRI